MRSQDCGGDRDDQEPTERLKRESQQWAAYAHDSLSSGVERCLHLPAADVASQRDEEPRTSVCVGERNREIASLNTEPSFGLRFLISDVAQIQACFVLCISTLALRICFEHSSKSNANVRRGSERDMR